jgi:hypothetical protein
MIPQPFVRRIFSPVNRNRKRHTLLRLAIIHAAPWLFLAALWLGVAVWFILLHI